MTINTTNQCRILVAAHSGCQGGAELCLDTTLEHLDRSRFEPVVVFGSDGPMVDRARERGIRVDQMQFAWWMCYEPSLWQWKNLLLGSTKRIRNLVKRIRQERIDLVYTNTAVIFEAALAARIARVPHVWHVHEVLTPHHMKPRAFSLDRIVRRIDRLSDRVLFESNSSRTIGERWISPEKTNTVYNSVRFSASEPSVDPIEARRGLDLPEDRPVVAWIGRFSERKNPLMLIRAISQIEDIRRAVFLFVGEGPLENEMVRTIAQLGLEDVCRIVPFQDDVRPVLSASDLLVLTSDEESFGLVLVEAGAYGLPVIATRVQGPSEIVDEGQTGLLVAPNDEAELAEALKRLLDDPIERQRMGTSGSHRVGELFSAKKNTRQIERVFDEITERSFAGS